MSNPQFRRFPSVLGWLLGVQTAISKVTGGNKGIGRALCQQLAADHGFYVFLGSRDAQRGKEAVESILLKSPECALAQGIWEADILQAFLPTNRT